MINKEALHDDLREAFVNYQYTLENPMPAFTENSELARQMYINNSIFNRKVDSLVAGVMVIVEKHEQN